MGSIAPAIASTGSGGSKGKPNAANILGGLNKKELTALDPAAQKIVTTASGLITNTGRLVTNALRGTASASRVGEVKGAANPSIDLGTGGDNGVASRQLKDVPELGFGGVNNLLANPNVAMWAAQLAMMPGSAAGGMMPPAMPNMGNLFGGSGSGGGSSGSGDNKKDTPSVPQRRDPTTPDRDIAQGNPGARLNQKYINAYNDIKDNKDKESLKERFEEAIKGVDDLNKEPLKDAYKNFTKSMDDSNNPKEKRDALENFRKELKENKQDPEEVLKKMFPKEERETTSTKLLDTSNIS